MSILAKIQELVLSVYGAYFADNSASGPRQTDNKGTGTSTEAQDAHAKGAPASAVFSGDEDDNRILGSTDDDTISGLGGNDEVYGREGDDVVSGGAGDDVLNGGDGSDTVDYSGSPALVTMRLLAGTATGEGSDTLFGFENATGSNFSDFIVGTMGANVLRGLDGFDQINGAAGDDIIYGGNQDDVLHGGGTGNDQLYGEEGDDTLLGSFGDDVMDGGNGTDTYQVGQPGGAVDVNLQTGVATGAAGTDTLVSIEDVIGSNGTDTYTGSDVANRITGGDGIDTIHGMGGADDIFGQEGNDFLNGGTGNDTLNGGNGNDIFVVENGTGHDTVVGFSGGLGTGDRIDLSDFVGVTGFVDLVLGHLVQAGPNTVITLDADDSLTLTNVVMALLAPDDFIF